MSILKRLSLRPLLVACLLSISLRGEAWEGMEITQLSVDGNQLVDSHGNVVKLHGFAQTYSPWFNEEGAYWTDYDVDGCLEYNQEKIDQILDAGWEMSFVRMHMDPYWSNTPDASVTGEDDISAFDFDRFKKYLAEVFIPMAEYAIGKGLYVIMRPPGVCPEEIEVGDEYNEYLKEVWAYVAAQDELRNNPGIMFELANEPVSIKGPNGDYGSSSQGHFDNLKEYFQSVVDVIRDQSCDNILWIPGLAYQSRYSGFAINPIEGDNIGYAVHVYPGWFGSVSGGEEDGASTNYEDFLAGWNEDVQPVADIAPIMVTEMDWAPEEYDASWGVSYTGTAGADGFGANFKKITDDAGNVSWLLFTGCEYLAQFVDEEPVDGEEYTFLTDPEACPWPVYHWYQEYAEDNYPRPDYTYLSHSDNGDGTYTNPVVFGDFPDPDVILVDDWYYMLTTTMHIFPGATILKSRDLVNWEYCCNPLERIENNDGYNLDNGQNKYAVGQWQSALAYNDGTYYLLYNTLDEGAYLMTTDDIEEGTWTSRNLGTSYYDPGLLFDDGSIYIVSGYDNLSITEVDEDFNPIESEQVITYSVKSGLEGSRLYKIGDYYYVYSTYGGSVAYQVAFRSTDIFGPYEEQEDYFYDSNIHQGALIQTQSGEWWTMLFKDSGAYGRLPNLQPVTWVDDWPVIGVDGSGVTTYTKPDVGREWTMTYLETNDCFRDYTLGKQWGWNHNADASKWSLVENAGYLRLYTASVVDSMHLAKNSLTQRILGYQDDLEHSYGTVSMDISNMADGDVAGLAVFEEPYAFLAIKYTDGKKQLVYARNVPVFATSTYSPTEVVIVDDIGSDIVYLRAVASYTTSKVTFYYSVDNNEYTEVENAFDMKYSTDVFVGNRFYIFNYATKALGGYVDIDWFSTEKTFEESTYFDNSFTGYSEETLTATTLSIEDAPNIVMITGDTYTLNVTATFGDGHTEDVTLSASYDISDSEIISIVNGRIVAEKDGSTDVTVTYTDPMDNVLTEIINVETSTFPLVEGLFNPSIYSTGTFDEDTRILVTGQYGFGGWEYSQGIDLSDYKYLVAKTAEVTYCGLSFRAFDENNYWSSAVEISMDGTDIGVIELQNATKADGSTLDPTHLYIIGFWSYGDSEIPLQEVYVTNEDDYSNPAGIDDIIYDGNSSSVTVYNLSGMRLSNGDDWQEAVESLSPGVYIINGKKIVIGR